MKAIETMLSERKWLPGIFLNVRSYLKIGYGVRGGQPGGAGVLLVTKGSVEGLGDGAQIEGTDGRR